MTTKEGKRGSEKKGRKTRGLSDLEKVSVGSKVKKKGERRGSEAADEKKTFKWRKKRKKTVEDPFPSNLKSALLGAIAKPTQW